MADLSGTWLGTYWQNGEPTRFEATLVQSSGVLSGSILDDCYLGEARVAGEVLGRQVQFTKHYLTTAQTPVQYTGTVSEDETWMQGSWSVGGKDSGPWEARRSGDDLMAELNRRVQEARSLATSVS